MTDDDERAAFEAWVKAPPYEADTARGGDRDAWPGQYQNYAVQLAWEAWMQRAGR